MRELFPLSMRLLCESLISVRCRGMHDSLSGAHGGQERNVLHELDRFRNSLDTLSDQIIQINKGAQVGRSANQSQPQS